MPIFAPLATVPSVMIGKSPLLVNPYPKYRFSVVVAESGVYVWVFPVITGEPEMLILPTPDHRLLSTYTPPPWWASFVLTLFPVMVPPYRFNAPFVPT